MRSGKTFGWALAGLLAAVVASAETTNQETDGASFMQDMDVSMKTMDHDMSSAPMNMNVDHDFAAMMIPHHQGAIDMAKGELKYGKDPIMRRLAEEIIVDQKSEIDLMNRWLKKQAATKGAP
jgi:uncharacterized protein (DUF305 family)